MSHSLQIINKGWDIDLLAVIAVATANSLNKMSYDQRWKLNRFIVQLKDAGIWENLDLLNVFACDEGTTSASNIHIRKIDLINKSVFGTNSTANNYTISSNVGIKGDNAILTNLDPATNFTQWTQNDASMFCYVSDNAQDSSVIGQETTANVTFNPRNTSNVMVTRINNSTAINTANTDSVGFWHVQRLASTGFTIYKDGSSFATPSSTSNALSTSEIQWNGNASNNNVTRYVGVAGLGSGLSGLETDLYDIWMTYYNSL